MSINLIRLSTGNLVVTIDEENTAEFTELVNRASQYWEHASPVMKEFADNITNGRVMQDYRSMEIGNKYNTEI